MLLKFIKSKTPNVGSNHIGAFGVINKNITFILPCKVFYKTPLYLESYGGLLQHLIIQIGYNLYPTYYNHFVGLWISDNPSLIDKG